ncbi:MAG TPA: biopolymer transporter ExbD [Rhodothermales bacterium]|nr:biopolymer transporter ExbD [Rhodothermales bacterium]
MSKPKRTGLRLDMTAMVDVAFLLLTFFMLTTQFKPPEAVEIDLPSSHAEVKVPGSDLLTITIAPDGRLFIAENTERQVSVQPDQLRDALVEMRSANPNLRMVIRADQVANYGVVEDVMKALTEARITRFSLVTDLETEQG